MDLSIRACIDLFKVGVFVKIPSHNIASLMRRTSYQYSGIPSDVTEIYSALALCDLGLVSQLASNEQTEVERITRTLVQLSRLRKTMSEHNVDFPAAADGDARVWHDFMADFCADLAAQLVSDESESTLPQTCRRMMLRCVICRSSGTAEAYTGASSPAWAVQLDWARLMGLAVLSFRPIVCQHHPGRSYCVS